MIFDAIYRQGNILGSALQAASVRNDVIVNNIANAEVPGFKAKTVDFEKSLTDAVNNFKRTGVLDLSNAKPFVRHLHPSFHYRIDLNNVDVELEMVSLYQNSIKFEAMINCVQRNSARLSLVLGGR
jgi:flagellar basal-body rod protein FlgB